MADNAGQYDPKKDPKRRAKSNDLLICWSMMHNFIFLSYYILFIIITPNAQLSPNRRHVDMSTQIFELDSTRLNEFWTKYDTIRPCVFMQFSAMYHTPILFATMAFDSAISLKKILFPEKPPLPTEYEQCRCKNLLYNYGKPWITGALSCDGPHNFTENPPCSRVIKPVTVLPVCPFCVNLIWSCNGFLSD
jgi:hypothetical protein